MLIDLTEQKRNYLKNHHLNRRIADNLSVDDGLNILNRINKYPKKRFNFKSPLETEEKELGIEILDKLIF